MNKSLASWLPWIILAIVVVVALFFVDFDRTTDLSKTVSEEVEAIMADVSVDEINDDDVYAGAAEEGLSEDFEDINR